jgi:hypothetical protein
VGSAFRTRHNSAIIASMTEPPFVIALRLEARLPRDGDIPASDIGSLPPVAALESSSSFFPDDELPARGKANEILRTSFAAHSMVNTRREPREHTGRPSPSEVLVTAQVVVQADLAPIPPGGEFPNVDDELLSDLILVHRAPTAGNRLWQEDAPSAGYSLLRQIIAELPRELWALAG